VQVEYFMVQLYWLLYSLRIGTSGLRRPPPLACAEGHAATLAVNAVSMPGPAASTVICIFGVKTLRNSFA